MTGKTKVEQFGFSPEQLLLRELRRIPEERVTAVLGVPAIVAGLGAGLDRSTFTNMAEAREAAYESGIIPTQRIIAEDIRFQLLRISSRMCIRGVSASTCRKSGCCRRICTGRRNETIWLTAAVGRPAAKRDGRWVCP
jgi:hypothetical protein